MHFSSRLSLTLFCPMDLRLYPMDRQICSIEIASCRRISSQKWHVYLQWEFNSDGHSMNDIEYRWDQENPVSIPRGFSSPRFSLEKHSTRYCTVRTSTGKF